MLTVAESAAQVRSRVDARDDLVLIGFFGDFSEASRAARPAFERLAARHPDLPAVLVDVQAVKGVHKELGVTAVPTVLGLQKGRVVQKLEGAQDEAALERALLAQAPPPPKARDAPPQPRVVVYTGERCSWCTRVKSYLRQNRVRFTEIDVSRDESAARALVARTGQQGVPQLDIGGQWIVGFDKARIDQLLGLRAAAPAG